MFYSILQNHLSIMHYIIFYGLMKNDLNGTIYNRCTYFAFNVVPNHTVHTQ